MRAVTFAEYGGPEVLDVAEVDEPHAGAGEVRIAVRASSVNPFDWRVRKGWFRDMFPLELPMIIGHDAAGVVDEVGDGVKDVAVGDEVFGIATGIGGAAAEYAVMSDVAPKPPAMSWEEAGSLATVVEASGRAFACLGGVKSGQTLLINGAAGGVGVAAVQLAVARGARVIGTASEGNHDFLRSLGAEPTTYGDGLVERVRALAPDGVDVAFDNAGQGALPDLIELTGDAACVVTISDQAAHELGVRFSSDDGSDPRAVEAFGEATKLYEDGRFQITLAGTFGFSEAEEAHRLSEGGHVRGKLVLIPD